MTLYDNMSAMITQFTNYCTAPTDVFNGDATVEDISNVLKDCSNSINFDSSTVKDLLNTYNLFPTSFTNRVSIEQGEQIAEILNNSKGKINNIVLSNIQEILNLPDTELENLQTALKLLVDTSSYIAFRSGQLASSKILNSWDYENLSEYLDNVQQSHYENFKYNLYSSKDPDAYIRYLREAVGTEYNWQDPDSKEDELDPEIEQIIEEFQIKSLKEKEAFRDEYNFNDLYTKVMSAKSYQEFLEVCDNFKGFLKANKKASELIEKIDAKFINLLVVKISKIEDVESLHQYVNFLRESVGSKDPHILPQHNLPSKIEDMIDKQYIKLTKIRNNQQEEREQERIDKFIDRINNAKDLDELTDIHYEAIKHYGNHVVPTAILNAIDSSRGQIISSEKGLTM